MLQGSRLYSIRPTYGGWQLFSDGERRRTFGNWREAVACADLLATRLNERFGIRTSVVMDMAGNDAVLVARHD